MKLLHPRTRPLVKLCPRSARALALLIVASALHAVLRKSILPCRKVRCQCDWVALPSTQAHTTVTTQHCQQL